MVFVTLLSLGVSTCSFVFFLAGGCAERKSENVEEDREEVFTVELQRGPHGLGLALVDGMVRQLHPHPVIHNT